MRYSAIGLFLVVALSAILVAGDAAGLITVKKDGTGNYTSITAALGELTASEIVVYPGVYQENISVCRPVWLHSYEGPNVTTIDGIGHTGDPVVRICDAVEDVRVCGFRIVRGYDGVSVGNHSAVEVCNCIIESNGGNGVYVYWNGGAITSAHVHNNVIYGNTRSGVYLDGHRDNYNTGLMYCTIINNIITKNQIYGLASDTLTYQERVTVAYNDLYVNVPFDNDGHYGVTSGIVLGPGMLSEAPQFLGAGTNDVRLADTSPCRDKGSPSQPFNNPDGTPNDMGAYGGPYAATFYESPTDGPIVREVVVTPGSVPRGANFSIEATVAVR